MVGNEGLKKSLDKSLKKEYKENTCQEILSRVDEVFVNRKDVIDAIRLIEGGTRKLKKALK